jgi:hypothetical protein
MYVQCILLDIVYNGVYYLKEEYQHWRWSYNMHEDVHKFSSCMWRCAEKESEDLVMKMRKSV